MLRLIARKFKQDRGSVAVEFALFLPVILLFLFAIIELGQAWYLKQMLVNASREGARMASLMNDPYNGDADVEQMVTDFLNLSGYPGAFDVTSEGADGDEGEPVEVTVTSVYQFPVLSSLVPGQLPSITLTANTIMRHE